MAIKKLILLLFVALPVAIAAVFGILWYQQLPLKGAMYYRDSGDLPTALASVDEYLQAYPNDEAALSMKAQILAEQGRFRETIDIYYEIGPATREDLMAYTKALVATQRWQMAAKTSETYEVQYGPDADNYLWSVISLSNIGDLESAVTQSQKLAGIEGKESMGLLLFGDLKTKQGDRQSTVQAYAKVLELNPEASGFHIEPEIFFENYVSVLLSLGRVEEAIAVADKGLIIRDTADLHYYRGNGFLALGNIEEAKKEWMLANREGVHVNSHLALAKQLLAEGDFERARAVMSLLVNLERIDSRFAYINKGIFEASGDLEKAEQWNKIAIAMRRTETVEEVMDTVITQQPLNPWSLVFRSYFLAKQQQWEDADEMLQSVKDQFSDEPAYVALKTAVDKKEMGPEVITTMEEQGLAINQ